jgi:YbbR domain-containing protein
MDKLYGNSWVLRIFALVLALCLFLYVEFEEELNRDNASTTTDDVEIIKNVPLEAYYDSENLIVSGLPETVNVTISGPSTTVLKTKLNQDFTVYVDLNDLMIGEHHVTIEHENISDKLEVSIDPVSVNISIEEKVTKQFDVEPELNSSLLAEGYVIDSLLVDPKTVSVTGAKSVLDSIEVVKATVTAQSGIKESFKADTPLRVLNSEANGVEVSVNPSNVTVDVGIKEYSKSVPVTLSEKGTLPEGIELLTLTPETKEITVYGKKAIIDELTNLVVEFDMADLTKSGTYDAKVVLPEGVKSKMETLKVKAEVLSSTAEETTQSNDSSE